MQKMMGLMRKCIDDYHMISPGDKIAVGVSGGKDSLTLLTVLAALRSYYPAPFELTAITIDMGLGGMDFHRSRRCAGRWTSVFIVRRPRSVRLFLITGKRRIPAPCAQKMRRGALNDAIRELGFNKVALGHHFDDAVETFLMSLFLRRGRIGCFEPVTYLSRSGVTQIRPMLYIGEKAIEHFAQAQQLPVVRNVCPADKHTKRQEIKELIASLQTQYPDIKTRIFGAMQRYPLSQWSVQK